jgi:enoyl-CoA hydratase
VIVLTGTDPAFCAGLDLKELGSSSGLVSAAVATSPLPPTGSFSSGRATGSPSPAAWSWRSAATSSGERPARFADTHARVGIMPAQAWRAGTFDTAEVARRRQAITDRGRSQES